MVVVVVMGRMISLALEFEKHAKQVMDMHEWSLFFCLH
jgi:hypothetical protein